MPNNTYAGVKLVTRSIPILIVMSAIMARPPTSKSHPISAQQGYENPREATGRIVCANRHSAKKPVDIEVPQPVLPDTAPEAVVRIPYDARVKQVPANGKKGAPNAGAVPTPPEGSKLATPERITPEIRERVGNPFFQAHRPDKQNIPVTGPVPGAKHSEIASPILPPDPATEEGAHLPKYPIYVGGNRGRGQIHPDGSKSNNTICNASVAGRASQILRKDKGGYEATTDNTPDGRTVVETVPPGPELTVTEGELTKADQPSTNNPNVGGSGQGDAEIAPQDPSRVQGPLLFPAPVIPAQTLPVPKKKQFEKVQLAEMKNSQ
uniref:Cytochrome f n=1 Tax=Selaginella hainanensis TaxID=2547368 RepID=A0A482CGY5_9TRAC|nr:cytochrome f [Selaginella hainanensis]QBL76106.1 cytochrome f [Selaginella hainanensis]